MTKSSIHSSESIRPLPISMSLAERESGIGYLYRLLRRNGLSLSQFRQMAGMDYRAFPNARQANLVSFLGSESPARLAPRFIKTVSLTGRKAFRLGIHRLSNAGHLRGRHPQVCIPCLYATGIADLAWEFTAVTCCPSHQTYLVDTCHHCQKPLSWDRPDLTICSCGRYLTRHDHPLGIPTAQELELATHLHALVFDNHQPMATIPAWVGSLSLDGISAFIRAFGLCTKPDQAFPRSRSFCRVGSNYWIELTQRAISRWMEPGGDSDLIRPWVNLPILERFHGIYASTADLEITGYWIRQLSGRLPIRPQIQKPIQGRLFQ